MGGKTGKGRPIPSFLPGRLFLERGGAADYAGLSRFHYRKGRPATWAGVWVVRYGPGGSRAGVRGSGASLRSAPGVGGEGRVVAVGVLSYPTLSVYVRDRVLGLGRLSGAERIRFINQNIRTISRIIVHPTFRALGLARRLVECMLEDCPTRYVEALAVMGRAHPFFERAGMRAYWPEGEGRPVYYLFDKSPGEAAGTGVPHSGQRSGLARRS